VTPDIIEHMFDIERDLTSVGPSLSRFTHALPDTSRTDAERIDLLRTLEDLKAAAAAAQARLTADLAASRRRAHADAGLPARRHGEGIAAQVALARRESPVRGAQHLGLALVLTTEMPHTLALMSTGRLSEWRATLLARETACLSLADRRTVDAELCADPRLLDGLSDTGLLAAARRAAYRLDPEASVARARRAETERRVTLRPAPDTMTHLTGLLPVAQGVAVHAALTRAADSLRATGDPRTRGQIMADTLVARVTGNPTDTAGDITPGTVPEVPPVAVRLVMTDRTLLAGDTEPAHLLGYGTVPAVWARDLVAAAAAHARAWVKRLYTAPGTGQLLSLDSRARLAPPGLREVVELRDHTCRTPWCGAPIRHTDHVVPHDADGPTAEANLQGLCERCNHAKQAPGWRARPTPGHRHTVVVTTPTGHRHTSTAPPPPGARDTRLDLAITALLGTMA
jgi:hypothetical protein